MSVISRTGAMWRRDSHEGHQLSKAWNYLVGRSTSKSEDAMLIFATLLGLDASEISSLSPSSQVKALISTQTSVSCSILTAHMQRNRDLADERERWLPTMRGELP